jgi:cation diffusion facilitator family transporter
LIADAIESTTDVFCSLLVLMGIKYSGKPADENHPYGHGKIEPLVTFLVVGFLICSAVVIAYHAVINIMTPHEAPESFTLYVLAAIIIYKEATFRIVVHKAHEAHSTALHADAWHHRSDAITSVAAFIGISIALIMGDGYESADDWAALIASAVLVYNSYLIFRPALGEVMDEHVHDGLLSTIHEVSDKVSGIKNIGRCLIRKSGMQYHIDIHAAVDGNITVREGHILAHKLEDALRAGIPKLGRILVHIEPEGEQD